MCLRVQYSTLWHAPWELALNLDMSFNTLMQPIRYLTDWAVLYYGSSRYDLASSGLPDCSSVVPPISMNTSWEEKNGIAAIEDAKSIVASMHDAPPELVSLTLGGSGALFMAAFVLMQKSRMAIIESPVYEPLHNNFEALGCEVRFLHRRWEDRYSLAALFDEAGKLSKGASCLMITNPNNPTGVYDDHKTIGELARAIYPSWLVINEIYLPFIPNAKSAFGVAENIVVLSSLTKAYGISMPRFGWVIAPKPLSDDFILASYNVYGRYPGTSAAVMIPVLEKLQQIHDDAISHLIGRHDFVDKAIADSKRLHWIRPPGNVILGLVKLEGINDDLAFAKALLDKRDVITGPGHFFREPGTLRIGIGAHSPDFDEGFERFIEFADKYEDPGER